MTAPAPGPNLGLTSGYPAGANGWGAAMNLNLRMLDAALFLTVQQGPLNAAPAIYVLGERFIVGPEPTGFWAAQANCIAVYTTDEFNNEVWNYIEPQVGMIANVIPTNSAAITATYTFAAGVWQVQQSSTGVVTSVGANLTLTAGEIAFNPSGLPVPFTVFAPGTLTANQVVWSAKFPFDLSAGETLTGWQCELIQGTATAATTLTLSAGGTTIATAAASAHGSLLAWTAAAPIEVPADTRIQVVGPAVPDTTAAGYEITLLFART